LRDLYAFIGRDLVGVFHEVGSDRAVFEYSETWGETPVSLSLSRHGQADPRAGFAYLDNLLPGRDDVRRRWANERGLGGIDPFTLLASYGEDVAGALTLSVESDLPLREPAPLFEASIDDIVARIAALSRENASWVDPRAQPRMSLAGAQGKFTLARVGDQWFWPTYEVPSTHIIKPPATAHPGIDVFEHLTLELARAVGVEASWSQRVEFLGQSAFITERWDRDEGVRLHAEDMNQALGNPTEAKYDHTKVGASQIARLLNAHGQAERFIRQLAFNVAVGNTDAHAKNYSVLLAGTRAVLAPIYDTLPVFSGPATRQLSRCQSVERTVRRT
jgi:serine/threonine-protein kinase HipA